MPSSYSVARFFLPKSLKISLLLFSFCFMFCVHNIAIVNRSFVLHSIVASVARYIRIPTSNEIHQNPAFGVVSFDIFNLDYKINNVTCCVVKKPFLVIFVKSQATNFEQRAAIRRSWGDSQTWKIDAAYEFIVMFIVGLAEKTITDVQRKLVHENSKHHDIVQINVVESFYTLTYKLIGQFKWVTKYCTSAKYFMTTDDDVFVHVQNLVTYLVKFKEKNLYLGCVHSGSPPIRNPSSKYYVPYSVYSGLYFPDYCPGAGYVLSLHSLQLLFAQASSLPLLYIDDVYAGLLANIAKIKPTVSLRFYCEFRVPDDPCFLQYFITSHSHSPTELLKMSTVVKSTEQGGYLCREKIFFREVLRFPL
ncbi:lactosylceramide 1,3-N-acetyl-beta-D-glucosaminyltransferase-like [Clavelina lepadiformis]|uniref:lactosylceramide 1,3-N-acetyl-beta-D-glucosaminyltransferase-like n=1 Tax=Clavelina lepadiformis TaxID=159417 RepID=UPI00404249C5